MFKSIKWFFKDMVTDAGGHVNSKIVLLHDGCTDNSQGSSLERESACTETFSLSWQLSQKKHSTISVEI